MSLLISILSLTSSLVPFFLILLILREYSEVISGLGHLRYLRTRQMHQLVCIQAVAFPATSFRLYIGRFFFTSYVKIGTVTVTLSKGCFQD